MRQKSLLKLVFLLFALIVGTGNTWAEDVTVTIASSTDVGTGTSASGSNSVSKAGITVSCTNGGFAISGGAHYRLASGSTTTISSEVGNIKSIVFNGPTGTGSNSISKFGTNTGWTLDSTKGTYTWSGDAESVTVKANSGQVRPTSITVIYTPSGGDTPTTYTVTYDCNGGTSGCPENVTDIEGGTSITLAAAPTKENCTFGGWNDGTTTHNAGSSYTVNGDVTMTAQWVANPSYTITAQSNNNSYGTVSLSGSVITGSPNSGYRYASPAYTVSPANSATVSQEGNAFTVTPSANTTVTINFEAIPTYTVTYSDGGSVTESSGGAGVTLATRPDIGGYTFAGWSTENVSTETTTAPTIISTSETYFPTADITLYPVYTRTEGGGNTESVNVFSSGNYNNGTITWSINNVVSILQEQNTGQTAPNSSYVSAPRWYSGNKITITPSVSINSISVTANTEGYATALANSTYTNATASASSTGVTITPTNGSNAITIVMGAQSRLSSLTVNYSAGATYYTSTPSGQEKVATPTITIPAGAFVNTKLVTITTETSSATIQYSTDGGSTWENYTAPFSINATTTVKAKASKAGMDDSDVAEKTFTKETVLNGLSALAAQTNTSDATYYVSLTDAQVTWANGSIGYMEDANTGIYLYNVTPTANLVYNGIFQVTYQVYNSMPEIKAITAVEGSTAAGSAKAATVMTTSALDAAFDANLGRQIQINGYTVPQAKTLTENINLYETSPYVSVTAGTTYTLVGYPFYAKVNGTVTKQFRITSAVEKVLLENAITGINDTYTVDLANNEDEVDLTAATATSNATVQYTVTSSTIDANDYDLTDGVLTVVGNGVITVRAYVDADADYNGAEKVVTVTVIDDPVIDYDGATESTPYGTPYTVDTDLIEGGNPTLSSSSNTNVATVSGLTITPVAVGTTTITINTAATDIWHEGTATFTLNVTQPEGKTTAPSGAVTTTFTNKDLEYNDVGTDWTASITANSFESSGDTPRGVQFGAAKGEFTLTATGSNVYKVSMVVSTNGTGNTIGVSVGGNTFTTTYGVEEGDDPILTMTSGMKNETVEFTGDAGNAVTISVNDADKSVYFKSITLYEEVPAITVTLNTDGYATFCSEYPLDFSNFQTASYSAWQITEVSGSTITFSQVTGIVKGGTGLLLKGTASNPRTTITLNSAYSESELSDNLLVGTLAPTYVAEQGAYYGLSGKQFKKVNIGTVPAGKALLPASVLGNGNAKELTFNFVDETTGIKAFDNLTNDDVTIYDLQGRRVQNPTKGIYVVNGKKVVIK